MPHETIGTRQDGDEQILVTGAAGLVGKELLKQLLEKGSKVKAIYNNNPVSLSHRNLEKVQCDILDVTALDEIMQGITNVYHCAAIVSFDPKDKHRLLKINVEGTSNVINACIDANVKKLLHVSSVAALGKVTKGEAVDENENWSENSRNSIYGKSKHLAELEVWRGQAEGLNTVIVNPTIILGGDDWNSGSSAIFKTAFDEFKWYTDGTAGFVDVKDVARAMILLMDSNISGQRFILNGENKPFKDIFTSIAKCFGRKPPYKKVTPFLAEIVWRTASLKASLTGKKHLLTKETARSAQSKVFYNNTKILKALPDFQFTSIEKTIERTCKILKEKYNINA